MRLTCPCCGERDLREFTYRGAAAGLRRPEGTDWSPEWDDFLHNRENPAGETRDLWLHNPCGTWIVVQRNTVTHEVLGTMPVCEADI